MSIDNIDRDDNVHAESMLIVSTDKLNSTLLGETSLSVSIDNINNGDIIRKT